MGHFLLDTPQGSLVMVLAAAAVVATAIWTGLSVAVAVLAWSLLAAVRPP
jgi:hypothetical protein